MHDRPRDRRADGAGWDILLVEDNPFNVAMMEDVVGASPLDARLHVAADGAAALAFLRRRAIGGAGAVTHAPRPDLVLLDLHLPKVDGHEVLAALKGDPALRDIPVVVLSTANGPHDIDAAYRAGANTYIVKPVDLDRFTSAIHAVLHYWLDIAALPRREGRIAAPLAGSGARA